MKPIYQVPVIPQNLRRDETVIQIAEVLNYLSDVTNDIFERVNNRISANNTRINALNERVDAANTKINKLAVSGANKATQVFSSSKYPPINVNKQHTSIFKSDKPFPFKHFHCKYESSSKQVDATDTLQIYHVKKTDNKNETVEGLGGLPQHVKSVNDLLLYNSGKNPYNNYVISDTLHVSQQTRKEDTAEMSEIGDAPLSISDRTTLTRSATDSFFYSPDLGDVPTIDLPIDLPDLPGIADDIRFVNDSGLTIAPSVSNSSNAEPVSTLEIVTLFPEEMELPPPPLPVEIAEPPATEQLLAAIEEKPTIPIIEEKSDVAPEVASTSPKPAHLDAHANLMDAIRKAGGSKKAKLKSAETAKEKPQSGGDLMADLHAKLSMRRKGISGEKKADAHNQLLDASSTMSRLSAIIPPPPTKTEILAPSVTEDDEWDD